jgi:TonB-linked SusC/RagA family outer membrane protein
MKRLYALSLLCGVLEIAFLQQTIVRAQEVASSHKSALPAAQPRKQKPLKNVLTELERKYKIYFTFESALLQQKYISQDVDLSQGLEESLQNVLYPYGLQYRKISERYYSIFPAGEISPAPTPQLNAIPNQPGALENLSHRGTIALPAANPLAVTITGRVTDDKGSGIPGVNVLLKGSTTGTTTRPDGNYSLSVPDNLPNAILVFSYIGYVTEEVPVGNRSTIDITLIADVKSLSEVVVVGYGTQQKKDVVGSVASLKSEEMNMTPNANLAQGLQGRIAGVQITQNSGAPGGNVSIRIRGVNSINGSSEPLYVIDGVQFSAGSNDANAPSPLSQINPNDIESIEVLKDASATAIYGARGANGVILITTRRGKTGKSLVSYDGYYGLQQTTNTLDVLNAREFAQLENEVFKRQVYSPEEIENMGEGTNWQNLLFRRAPIQNHQLSLSSGNDKTQFFISGNYFNQDGIIINSNFTRYSLRINLDHQLSRRVKVGSSVFGSHSTNEGLLTASSVGSFSNSPTAQAGLLPFALAAPPTLVPYREDGTLFPFADQRNGFYDAVSNPVGAAEVSRKRTIRRNLVNLYFEFKVLENLTYRASFSADLNNTLFNFYSPRYILPSGVLQTSGGGNASKSNSYDQSLLHESIVTYSKQFAQNHSVILTGVFATQKINSESNTANSDFFPNDVLTNNALQAGVNQTTSSSAATERLDSYMARSNYNFKEKYYLDLTLRADGSSKFGANNKYGFFPAIGAAWRIIEEPFMAGLGWVSDLKLRGSWGITGNAAAISPYRSLATFEALNTYQFNNAVVVGIQPSGIANPDLRWEKSTQVNIGLDFSLLQNRLSFIADIYSKRTEDLLFSKVLPITSGYGSILGNYASIENKGIELALDGKVFVKDLKWSISPNLTINRNKVLGLDGSRNDIGAGQTSRIIVGQPIGIYKSFVWDGIYQTGDAFLPGDNGRLGGARTKDVTGDGRITEDDQVIVGNPHPDFIFGVTSSMQFKGFDASFLIQGTQGNDIWNNIRTQFENPLGQRNMLKGMINRWSPENPSNEYVSGFQGGRIPFSDRFVEDGSFVRVRSIILGYTLPKIRGISNARIYLNGSNLFTFTNYSGFDPEVNSRGGSNTMLGIDEGTFPASKSILLGVQLSF